MGSQFAGCWRGAMMVSAPIVCMAAATPALAQVRSFNIEAQDAAGGVAAFARQADIQLLVSERDARGRRTNAVQGNFQVAQALERLLADTGLRAVATGPQTWTVVPARGEGEAGGAAADSGSADEEIVILGTNIRGLRNRTAPVTVLDRDYIESTGHGTTTRLLQSVPQNFALASQSAPPSFPGVTSDRSQGEAINLRGIGEGTTLVLLNGRRLPLGFDGTSTDISMLPLSAIERVEILTDGASALYGADAVGGVVNFVIRRDFEGAETSFRAGWAPGGLNEYRASQTVGTEWGSGSALLSGEYYHRDLLETADRDFIPTNTQIRSLLPRDETVSLAGSARQSLSTAFSLFADALYSHRDTFNRAGRFSSIFAEDSDSSIHQFSGNSGVAWTFAPGWSVEISGGYGRYDRHSLRGGVVNAPRSISDGLFESWTADAKADGSLFEIPGGAVRVAIGGSYRSESFSLLNSVAGTVTNRIDEDQRVSSLFGEVNVPIFGASNAVPGIRRLGLSLAARYDDYSNFGSSFDPRIGIAWEPAAGLLLRGSYGTSYVAPKLSDFDPSSVSAAALFFIDPGVPGGVSYQLQVAGGADVTNLKAQQSRNLTAGIELQPVALPGFRLAFGYYDIKYDDQIALPPQSTTVLLGNPAAFGSLFIRDPTVAQVQQYLAIANAGRGFFPFDAFFMFDPNFDPASIQVIIDVRRRNLSEVRTRGLDFSASYDFQVGSSNIHLGLDGVYIFERTQQVTATSVAFETVDTLYNPPEIRLRASAGWRHGGWSLNAFANHVGAYTDNRIAPFLPVESWTTIDLNFAYRFQASRGPLSRLTLGLSATNLFNEDPPVVVVRSPFEIGFDPSNANPLGRLLSVEVTKRW